MSGIFSGTLKISVLAAAIVLTAGTPDAHAECGEVSITEMNWASASVVTNVAKFIMEQGYGCKVTAVPSDTVPAATSLAENGEPDIATEMWINSAPVYLKLESEGKVKTISNVLSDGGAEHWLIPKYLAEKHPELKTIEGVLANPELVGGRFHNCPEGWGCRIVNDSLKQAFDLEGRGIEVFNHGSGDTLAASIGSAYTAGKPWFGYYWAPTALLGKFEMVPVDLGPYVDKIHQCNRNPDCKDVGKSSYPSARVVTGVTTDFAAREPEVVAMLSKLSFTNQQMGAVLAWKEDKNASIEETTVHFLTTYKDVWGNWLNDEARTKLAGLLK
ncbi:MAG: glycine/betaine ABC transporter substrate-binding protein [Alphaproteobacteria bacterium]|nr:glycine/betaine ABC transporter substrate-binding protein [Alphaproteobacteria bacterium]|tara:strand:- start:1662 stop:2648 length:987 start_codon:yes stop_codon:yes gene_type:complete